MSISVVPTSAAANVPQAARVLPASTDGSGDVEGLAGQLGDLAEALRLAAKACESAIDSVVPKRAGDARVARMYAEAALRWPSRPVPSHERFASTLAELHRSADAMRRASHEVERAKEAVELLLAAAPSKNHRKR